LPPIPTRYECLAARVTILGFSLAFFGAVFYKTYRRRRELQSKALTTFKFLLEREAIETEATKKEEKDTFDKNLKEIEEYLNNGDWTLAGLSSQQVMKGYDDSMTREWIEKKKITAEEGKDEEKKASAEEIKNVGNKKVNYQDVGIYWTTY
jgi:hypothetical protein